MKNLIKWCKLLVIALVSFFGINSLVNAAPSSITMGTHGSFPDYIGTINTTYKKTNNGTFIYCTEYSKRVPATGTIMSKGGEMDAGIAYIIANGYPNKTFTGDNYKDYYITQLAMWWYIDATNGKNTADLKALEDGVTYKSNELYSHIVTLKNDALVAKNNGYVKPSMTISLANNKLSLDSTGKYYVSNAVSINGSNLNGNYKVTLLGAPEGSFVENVNGTKGTEFSQTTKFIVKVPVAKISQTSTNFTVSISIAGLINKAYVYSTKDISIQKVTMLYPETSTIKASTTLRVVTDKTNIAKTDSVTGKSIAGATLVLKDAYGKQYDKWVSTNSAHVIYNLPAGKYYVSEIVAPKGYEKSNKTYGFTISNVGKDFTISIPNVELVKTSQVEISKQDITTKEELPGAKLTIKDINGKVIDSWTSSNEPHYITLEVGKYNLTEETSPEGYDLNTEVISFEVIGNEEIVKVVMYNTPTPEVIVEVPKTGVNSIIIYTITIAIIGLGLGLVYKYGKANK